MAVQNLIIPLMALCEIEPPEITGQGIEQSGDHKAFNRLVGLGALAHVGNAESVLCLACDHPHSINVEYTGDGRYRSYCPDTGYQSVLPEQLRRFALSEEWIAGTVASKLELNVGKQAELVAPSTVLRIGRARFRQYPCELFFARRLFEGTRFDGAKREISRLTGKAPAIVLTTTSADLIAGEPPARCAIIALQEVLQVSSTNTVLEEGPFYAALRGPDHRYGEVIGFAFSPGFRSAVVGDQEYQFTDKQALAVEALDEARRIGLRLHQTEIQGAAGTSQRVVQLFAGHPAYGTLIKHDGQGHYWLDL